MNRIDHTFRGLRTRREAALVVYLMTGFPTPDATVPLLRAAADAGADLIELGVPFSDPLADGPVLQAAARVSLANGTTAATSLAAVAAARRAGVRVPIVLMSYVNPLLAHGGPRVADDLAAAGGDGLIVPDLPPQAAGEWLPALDRVGLPLVRMIAPTTDSARAARIATGAGGFLYCVAVTGVTGARRDLPADLPRFLGRLRGITDLPLAVGFGISTPDHVRRVAGVADGAVVGTALAELIRDHPGPQLLARVGEFVRGMKAATRREGA